jgi:hypothetical protein
MKRQTNERIMVNFSAVLRRAPPEVVSERSGSRDTSVMVPAGSASPSAVGTAE